MTDSLLPSRGDRLAATLLMVAAVLVGLAVRAAGGTYSPIALAWLTLGLLAGFAALAHAGRRSASCHGGYHRGLLLAALCVQFPALLWEPTLVTLTLVDVELYRLCTMLLAGAGVLAGSAVMNDHPAERWGFSLLVLVHLAVGWIVISCLPRPGIDVLMFQDRSWEALLRGTNPYALHFPDPYPPASSAKFYGPGVSVGGILQFGYPYLPATLWLAAPGFAAGDVRYASLGAIALAAILIAGARPGRSSRLAATALLFTPALPVMVYSGWTDSYVLLLLALVWFCQCRAPRFVPFAAGLLICSKQYAVILVPLLLLLVDRPWTSRRVGAFAIRALIPAGVVTLPLALWDLPAFWNSAVALQFRQPFRSDSLSYLAGLSPAGHPQLIVVPFVATAALWLWLWRTRERINFPLAAALVLAVFFALNKQAFANYYFLVIGGLCVAAAATDPLEPSESGRLAA